MSDTSPQSRDTRRVTLPLDAGRSVTLIGAVPSVDGLIALLEEALGKARKARQLKLGLKTFQAMLKDQQAGAES